MKLYDKVYVPHNLEVHGVFFDNNYYVTHEGIAGSDGPPREVVPELNAIVLTLGELRECFDWGAGSQEDTKELEDCFKEFLQTKGINL